MINVLWMSNNPVSKRQMQELNSRYGNEIKVYEMECKLHDMLFSIDVAIENNIDIFESDARCVICRKTRKKNGAIGI